MADEALIYLPLGGAGEIGMNMYLYGYGKKGKQRFILVDVGVTFPDMETSPGVDLIMADPEFIAARAAQLDGIFITHAHEDHIGALAHLYPQLKAPVFARPFTAEIARGKLNERGLPNDQIRVCAPYPESVTAGPFTVSFAPVAHSIPEASALVIDTPAGRIIHSGDFKIDRNPVVGEAHSDALWSEIGKAGVKALICDSTNVFTPHAGRSESSIGVAISERIRKVEGMMVATTFASNVARLKTLAQAGGDAGRKVVVMGRAMERMLAAAHKTRVIEDFPPLLSAEEAYDVPRGELMLLVTGSQGERRAASAQLAAGAYRGFEMRKGDGFMFSSKTIPGNELAVGYVINKLCALGVDVIDDTSGDYHVSGHANRPDLMHMQELVQPDCVVPMHGEYRHLQAHAQLAEDAGRRGIIAPNGTMLRLSGAEPKIIDQIETGRVYRDGAQLIGAYDGVVLARLRMAMRGHAAVSLVFEGREMLGGAYVQLTGLADPAGLKPELLARIEEEIDAEIDGLKPAQRLNDDVIEGATVRALRRITRTVLDKKPVVSVLINRLETE